MHTYFWILFTIKLVNCYEYDELYTYSNYMGDNSFANVLPKEQHYPPNGGVSCNAKYSKNIKLNHYKQYNPISNVNIIDVVINDNNDIFVIFTNTTGLYLTAFSSHLSILVNTMGIAFAGDEFANTIYHKISNGIKTESFIINSYVSLGDYIPSDPGKAWLSILNYDDDNINNLTISWDKVFLRNSSWTITPFQPIVWNQYIFYQHIYAQEYSTYSITNYVNSSVYNLFNGNIIWSKTYVSQDADGVYYPLLYCNEKENISYIISFNTTQCNGYNNYIFCKYCAIDFISGNIVWCTDNLYYPIYPFNSPKYGNLVAINQKYGILFTYSYSHTSNDTYIHLIDLKTGKEIIYNSLISLIYNKNALPIRLSINIQTNDILLISTQDSFDGTTLFYYNKYKLIKTNNNSTYDMKQIDNRTIYLNYIQWGTPVKFCPIVDVNFSSICWWYDDYDYDYMYYSFFQNDNLSIYSSFDYNINITIKSNKYNIHTSNMPYIITSNDSIYYIEYIKDTDNTVDWITGFQIHAYSFNDYKDNCSNNSQKGLPTVWLIIIIVISSLFFVFIVVIMLYYYCCYKNKSQEKRPIYIKCKVCNGRGKIDEQIQNTQSRCTHCNGVGSVNEYIPCDNVLCDHGQIYVKEIVKKKCIQCLGTGQIRKGGDMSIPETCKSCNGKGEFADQSDKTILCNKCNNGQITKTKTCTYCYGRYQQQYIIESHTCDNCFGTGQLN